MVTPVYIAVIIIDTKQYYNYYCNKISAILFLNLFINEY
jgi:hypothetical protein